METNIAINNDAPALSGDIALIEDRTSGQPYLFVTAIDGANNLVVNRYTIAAGTDAVAGQNVATIPGAFGGADLQLSQQANKLLVEYYTETPNPVTFTAKGEIMVYELDADYLPVAGVTDGIELTGETPERGSAVFSASGNIIYYRDENTADGYIRSIDLENTNTIDPLSSVTGNLLTAYNNNTYLTAGPDDNLYHWQEGEGVDFEVVSNSLTDILPQLSVKTGQSATGPVIQFVTRHLGDKYYELKDHLGNVRATISDLRTMQAGLAQASVESYNNYYPLRQAQCTAFGMLMPGRWNSSENYRYGFNGKEMDNDMRGGTGVTYDYGFRIYDSRIAKFLSVDPLTASYPWYTPYQFAGNKPIRNIDLDGLEEADYVYLMNKSKELYLKAETDPELKEKLAKSELAALGISILPGLLVSGAAEVSLIAGTSWSELPAITALTGIGSNYINSALGAKARMHLSGFISELGGQYIGNLISNTYSNGLSVQTLKDSYYQINLTSTFWSTVNPTNKLSTFGINGFLSSAIQISPDFNVKMGSINEILAGTAFEIGFGHLSGKTNGGALNTADEVDDLINMNLDIIKKSSNKVRMFDKVTNTMTTFLPDHSAEMQRISSLKSWEKFLRNLDLTISTIGQGLKTSSYNETPK